MFYLDAFFDYVPGAPTVSTARVPYFFLDFERMGNLVFAFIAGIGVFIIFLGHAMYLLDRKRRQDPSEDSC